MEKARRRGAGAGKDANIGAEHSSQRRQKREKKKEARKSSKTPRSTNMNRVCWWWQSRDFGFGRGMEGMDGGRVRAYVGGLDPVNGVNVRVAAVAGWRGIRDVQEEAIS
jgi:hypothetical protein